MNEEIYRCEECGKTGAVKEFTVMVPNEANHDDKTLYEALECPECGSGNVVIIEE